MQEEDGSIYENVDETMLYIVLLEEMLKESTVWEEITGKESVSTISILAKASEENIDILLLSKANLSTEIEKLNTDETKKQSIINAVNSGKIGICLTDENVQIWKYTSSTGDYVFYNNGYIQFPERYLYPDTNISVLDIGTFTTTIYVFTERKPCLSCEGVINKFKEMFPNIKLFIIYQYD